MMGKQHFGQTYHEDAAENYERFFVPAIGEPLATDLVGVAALRPAERVLDVACGTGVVTRMAAKAVGPTGSVAGVDVNPGMLAVARSAASKDTSIEWYEANAESLPLPNDAFDVVLCQLSLQFMSDQVAALKEMRRVLADDGRLALNVPGPAGDQFDILADAMDRLISPQAAGFVRQVFSLHDPAALERLAGDAGFREITVNRKTKTLRVPGPNDFLWQYVHSTPLVGVLGQATEQAREALERDVVAQWQEFENDGAMTYEQPVTLVTARK